MLKLLRSKHIVVVSETQAEAIGIDTIIESFFPLSCRYWEWHFRVPTQQKKYNFVVGCWNFVGTHCSYPKFTGSPHWSVVGCIFMLPSEI